MCDANFLRYANRAGVQAPVGHPQDKGPRTMLGMDKQWRLVIYRVMYRKPSRKPQKTIEQSNTKHVILPNLFLYLWGWLYTAFVE